MKENRSSQSRVHMTERMIETLYIQYILYTYTFIDILYMSVHSYTVHPFNKCTLDRFYILMYLHQSSIHKAIT